MAKERDYAGKLYDTFHKQMDGFTKTEPEFRKALESPEYQTKVYKTLVDQMEGFTRKEGEFYSLLKKKENTNIPSASFGMGDSSGGKGKLPVGVASQSQLKKQGVETKQISTPRDIYKGVVVEAQKDSKTKPLPKKSVAKSVGETIKSAGDYLGKANDVIVETLSSGVTQVASGLSGLVGGTASLMVNKKADNNEYPFMSNEWIKQKLTQQGEVKNPAWFTNQGIRDTFMSASKALSQISTAESEVAKKDLGVTNAKKMAIEHVLEGNYLDAAKSALVDIGTQIPMLAVMVSSAGAGYPLMGASSMGSELNRQYEQDGDINTTDMVQGATAGISEVIAEKFFDMDLRAGRAMGSKISDMLGVAGNEVRERIQREGVDKVVGEITRSFSDVVQKGLKGFGQEWLEENVVSLSNFLGRSLDEEVFNEKEYQKLILELGNNALVAGPLGGGMSTLAASASMTPLTEAEKVKISRFEDVLNDETASKEVKKIAKAKIDEIKKGVSSSSEATYNEVVRLPLVDRVEATEKLNRISKLEEEANKSNDVDIKDSIKERITQLRSELDTTFKENNERIQSLDDTFNKEKTQESEPIENTVDEYTFFDKKTKGTDVSEKVKGIEDRINNAEEINEKELTDATDSLYEMLDQADNINAKTEPEKAFKEALINKIEDKINKIESYEFETETKTIIPEQTRPVVTSRQVVGTTKRGGSKSNRAVTNERLDGKSVTTEDGESKLSIDNEGVVSYQDKEGNKKDLDFNYIEYSETVTDENGVVSGVTLVDKRDGKRITVNDQDLAYDIAIKAKTDLLGDIEDSVFDEVYETVTIPAVTKEELKDKGTSQNASTTGAPPIIPPSTGTASLSGSGSNPGPNPTNPNPSAKQDATSKSEEMYEESENAVKKSGTKTIRDRWQRFKELVGNRKTDVENVITTTEKGIFANTLENNISGSTAYADSQFRDAVKRVYGQLVTNVDKKFGPLTIKINTAITEIDKKKEALLDQVIFHRRVIAIDENRAKKNESINKEIEEIKAKLSTEKSPLEKVKQKEKIAKLKEQLKEPIKHPKGFDSKSSKDALEGFKEKYGEKEMDDISQRADAYFDIRDGILQKMRDNDLITEEDFDNLKDTEYVERKFLEYILSESENFGEAGFSEKQIKALKEGSEGLVLMDSRVLLHSAFRSVESNIARNKANKALAEAVAEGKYNEGDMRMAKYKKNLNGTIVTDKFGKPQLEPAPTGMKTIKHLDKGVVGGVYAPIKLYNQWFDLNKGTSEFSGLIGALTQTQTLKTFATLLNSGFALGNVPLDYMQVLKFTDVYDKNIFTAAPLLIKDFTANALQYSLLKTGVASDSFRSTYEDYVKAGGKFEFLHMDGKADSLHKSYVNRNRSKGSKVIDYSWDALREAIALPGEISEISMRLAVFDKTRKNLIKEFGGKANIDEKTMNDINSIAAEKSRSTMDYNRGGLLSKKLDKYSPYINAKAIGTVTGINYVKKNPKKFAQKMALHSAEVAALTLFSLMSLTEEEEENIPAHIKENYYLLPLPTTDKDGNRELAKIKVHPGVKPFKNGVEYATKMMYNMVTGKNYGKNDDLLKSQTRAVEDFSPIPFTLRGAVNMAPPTAAAAMTYLNNYDYYRDATIEKRKDVVPIKEEGLDNDKTARIYRVLGELSSKLGEDFTLSPSRTQAAVEKVITNPQTNFIVGKLYQAMDAATSWIDLERESVPAKKNSATKSLRDKAIYTINPETSAWAKKKENDLQKEIKAEDDYQRKMIKQMVYAGHSEKEVKDFINTLKISDDMKTTRLKMAYNMKEEKDLSISLPYYDELMDVKYVDGILSPTPEDKAKLLFDRFSGVNPDSEDFKEIIESAEKMKIVSKGRFNKRGQPAIRKDGSKTSYDRLLQEYRRIYDLRRQSGK